jgi:hypothetical protein
MTTRRPRWSRSIPAGSVSSWVQAPSGLLGSSSSTDRMAPGPSPAPRSSPTNPPTFPCPAQFSWPPALSSAGRQRSLSWPRVFRSQWPVTVPGRSANGCGASYPIRSYRRRAFGVSRVRAPNRAIDSQPGLSVGPAQGSSPPRAESTGARQCGSPAAATTGHVRAARQCSSPPPAGDPPTGQIFPAAWPRSPLGHRRRGRQRSPRRGGKRTHAQVP